MTYEDFIKKCGDRKRGDDDFNCPHCGKVAEKAYSMYGKSWRCCGMRWWEDDKENFVKFPEVINNESVRKI